MKKTKFTIELDEYDTNNITFSTWISQNDEYIQQHTKRIMRDIAWQILTQLETKQTQCNKICKNCMFFETYFENWSPMDMCEHVVYTGPNLLYGGPDETRGLYTIENVRYNEKLCGESGRWYVERPKGFDKLPYDERQKIRKQNE